jgi:hypothetical protein
MKVGAKRIGRKVFRRFMEALDAMQGGEAEDRLQGWR